MDAFTEYNQIRIAPKDKKKTVFVTDQGPFCYRVMPLGLKNTGATYQRFVNKIFKLQIDRNMKVYIDDILVKNWTTEYHVADLEESFAVLQQFRMKLNPSKSTFGVTVDKFFDFMVSQRGIEVNPKKIRNL